MACECDLQQARCIKSLALTKLGHTWTKSFLCQAVADLFRLILGSVCLPCNLGICVYICSLNYILYCFVITGYNLI